MDVVEYVKQRERMCNYYIDCDDCPASILESCSSLDNGFEIVEIVEQWAKEHPVKTRQSEVLKQYPEAEIGDDGLPSIAPCQLDVGLIHGKTQKDCEDRGVCDKCRHGYWLKEVNENKED